MVSGLEFSGTLGSGFGIIVVVVGFGHVVVVVVGLGHGSGFGFSLLGGKIGAFSGGCGLWILPQLFLSIIGS